VSEVRTQIDIAATPEEIWAVVQDPSRFADWVTIHRAVKGHSEQPDALGAKVDQTLCLRGVKFDVHWELVARDEPTHAEWHGRGPARSHAETEYTLSPLGDGRGTRFTYRNEFKAPMGPLGAVASRALVGGLPEKEARASLRRLKALLEKH
jgi:carbon monoxide dehydrogenase subunit G